MYSENTFCKFIFFTGNGYYLNGPKPTKRITDSKKKKSNFKENETEHHKSVIKYEEELEMPVEIIIVSLWYWWKEVLFISVLTAVLINIIIPSRLARIITFIQNYLVSLFVNLYQLWLYNLLKLCNLLLTEKKKS